MIRKGTKVEFYWITKKGVKKFVGKVLQKDEDYTQVWAVEEGKRKGYREFVVPTTGIKKYTAKKVVKG